MNWLKKIAFGILVILISCVVWANWYPPEISTLLPKVRVSVFKILDSKATENSFVELKNRDGVSALKFSEESSELSIIYEPSTISSKKLSKELTHLLDGQFEERQYVSSGAECPVQGMELFKHQLKELFCFRQPNFQND